MVNVPSVRGPLPLNESLVWAWLVDMGGGAGCLL